MRQYFRQRVRWYSYEMGSIFGGRGMVQKLLGSVPATIEVSSGVSLLAFAYELATRGDTTSLALSIAPFLMSNAAMMLGFYRVGKKGLIKCVPAFLTFDSMLQMSCLIYTKAKKGVFDRMMKRLGRKEPQHWPLLASGKYYSSGTEIRTDI